MWISVTCTSTDSRGLRSSSLRGHMHSVLLFSLAYLWKNGSFFYLFFSAVFYELRDLPLICGDLSFLGNPSFSTIKCKGSHFPPRKYSIYRGFFFFPLKASFNIALKNCFDPNLYII